jgi:outer membrane protein assembly factor BamA
VPSTDRIFPGQFDAARDINQLWLGFGIAYDTRDSVQQAYSGSRVGLSTRTAVAQSNGEFAGGISLDAQTIFALPPLLHAGGHGDEENPPTDVFAVGAFLTDTHGELPFFSLPSLGGNSLRGYSVGRFTDRSAAYGSIEYRFGIIPRGFMITEHIRVERVGMVLFYDFGTVASGVEELTDGKYLDSVGFGLQFGFSREASFRVDYGISDEDRILTFGFGNSF